VWEEESIQQIWLKPPGVLIADPGAEPAYISETFARRFDLLNGGTVQLETATGSQAVTPIGIYSDYGNEFGAAVIDLGRWREWVQSERPINTSAHLKADADVNEVRDRLRLQFPGLDIRNGQELRDLALGIFEQTFQVTAALNGIGVVVAIAGLLLGLFAIFEESNRTWETLDHLGFSLKRLVVTAGIEGAGIALSAWISGTLIGIVLGWLLIAVINVQSFGWTLQWQLPVVTFVYFGGVLVLAGFLCGSASGAWWHLKRLG
ncbi:MAG: FtsX-like permease family protein, partial [Verrucomicrobiota bacterium]